MSFTAEATVEDVNRQRWSASQTVMIHPASVYVGLKPDKGFYEEDDEILVDIVTSDIDGEIVPGVDVVLTLARLDWENQNGQWQQVETDPETCERTSEIDPTQCTFELAEGGNHRLTAQIHDALDRPNQTSFEVWVSGGSRKQAPKRDVEQERVVLVPDAEQYQPGDTASILVQAPFFPAHGILQIRRRGIIESRTFTMEASTQVIEVPLVEASIPNLHVEVDLVGSAVRRSDEGEPLPDKARRVAYASGSLEVNKSPTTVVIPHRTPRKLTSYSAYHTAPVAWWSHRPPGAQNQYAPNQWGQILVRRVAIRLTQVTRRCSG